MGFLSSLVGSRKTSSKGKRGNQHTSFLFNAFSCTESILLHLHLYFYLQSAATRVHYWYIWRFIPLSNMDSEHGIKRIKTQFIGLDIHFLVQQSLTELIKVCVHSIWSGDRTHEPSLEEGGPLIGQTPQPTHIILKHNHIPSNKSVVSIVQLSNTAKRQPQ